MARLSTGVRHAGRATPSVSASANASNGCSVGARRSVGFAGHVSRTRAGRAVVPADTGGLQHLHAYERSQRKRHTGDHRRGNDIESVRTNEIQYQIDMTRAGGTAPEGAAVARRRVTSTACWCHSKWPGRCIRLAAVMRPTWTSTAKPVLSERAATHSLDRGERCAELRYALRNDMSGLPSAFCPGSFCQQGASHESGYAL